MVIGRKDGYLLWNENVLFAVEGKMVIGRKETNMVICCGMKMCYLLWKEKLLYDGRKKYCYLLWKEKLLLSMSTNPNFT